jgi:hypothetical protein
MVMTQPATPPPIDELTPGWLVLLKILLGFVTGGVIFVLLWAGLNWSWATVLETTIAPAVFEEPCQRLTGAADRLTRFSKRSTSRTGRLIQRAICHFGERATPVNEATWSKEFEAREFGVFLLEGAGLFACIFGAILGTVALMIRAGRAWDRLAARWIPTPAPPDPARPRRSPRAGRGRSPR